MLISLTALFVIALFACCFYRLSAKFWSAILIPLLILVTYSQVWSLWVLIPTAFIVTVISVLMNMPRLRAKLVTQLLINKIQKTLPVISRTEQEALDAGDTWLEADLFQGAPNWEQLHQLPKPTLTKEEQSFIDNQVETLCSMLNDWEIVHQYADLPNNVWKYIKAEGFFGLCIGKEYGGHGFSAYAHSIIVTKIATRSLSAAVDVMVPNSLGPGELLHHYGTAEQKQHYLPRLAKGLEVPCFGLTTPEAGSDAGAMKDTGVVCKGTHDGEEVLGIRLNIDKRYITLAPVATVIGLAFKLYDPEQLLGEEKNIGITVALIPAKHKGIEIGQRHCPLRMAFMNGPIRGKDIFIPLDWIIGGAQRRGQGWMMLMECLSIGRCISLPSVATAVGQLSYRMTGAYAKVRQQFNTSIGKFEGIEEPMARIGAFTYACNATRSLGTTGVDLGIKPSVVSAIAKYHITEMGRVVQNDAMDVHAGKGIQLGPMNYLGLSQDAVPVAITVEGANILTRNLMIFGQGAIRCHPFVREEIAALQSSDKAQRLSLFDRALFKHIGYFTSNKVKCFLYGLTAGKLIFIAYKCHPQLRKYYRQITRLSVALAWVSDLSMMLLGGQLKRKERLSARLGDVLSHLYMSSAVLKYFQDHGAEAADLPYVKWLMQHHLYKTGEAFDGFFANFPNRLISKIVRWIVFPWGRHYQLPSDRLGSQITQSMMQTSHLRNRLTQDCYVGKDEKDSSGLMEKAFVAQLETENLQLKIKTASRSGQISRDADYLSQCQQALDKQLITTKEHQALVHAHELYWQAIQVDEFKPTEFAKKKRAVVKKTTEKKATPVIKKPVVEKATKKPIAKKTPVKTAAKKNSVKKTTAKVKKVKAD